MKVLLAPFNVAGQPGVLARELRLRGVDATMLVYGVGHQFGYAHDRAVDVRGRHRFEAMVQTVQQTLEEGVDIYHLWRGPLLTVGAFSGMYGMELPLLKVRGKRVVFSPTGFDVRVRSLHEQRNPYNPFRYGYELELDWDATARFAALLGEYVDTFTVLDPELGEYLPGAPIIPRAVDLAQWAAVGVGPTDRPLVVHAPSQPAVKGTPIIERALQELAEEGVAFELKLITGMRHDEARRWYERADLVIDQIHIGWYGVLAVEAMALGKPVVSYIRPDLLDGFTPEPALANANPDTVKDVLRELLSSSNRRMELGERARAFAEEVHDVRVVAASLHALYTDLMARPARQPTGTADIDWFLEQFRGLDRADERLALLRKARAADAARAELPGLRELAAKVERLRTALQRSSS